MSRRMPRLARVELLLGASLDEVAETHLKSLVDASASEAEDLDFKKGVYWIGPNKRELGKDVAALANHVGGLLIIGVDEDGNARAKELTPQKIDEGVERGVQEIVADHVHPTPLVATRQVDGAVGRYLLVAVPRSPLAPHAVQQPGTDLLGYPVRSGTTTRWLTETEIADRYLARFREGAAKVDVAEHRARDVPDRLAPRTPWLSVSVTPDLPARVSIDAAGGRFVAAWLGDLPPTGIEQDRFVSGQPAAQFGPGRFIFGTDHEGGSQGYHVEMYGDGASVIAFDISDPPDNSGMFPVPDVLLTRAMVAALGLAAHYAVDVGGVVGTAAAFAEIVEPHRGRPGHLEHSMILMGSRPAGTSGFHMYRRVPGTAAPLAVPPSRHIIDLGAVRYSMTERLAAAHLLLKELVQGFGVAEPVHMTSAGALRVRYFQPPPTSWARAEGVDLDSTFV